MRRRSLRICQKRKTDVVPLDLQIQILNRLPAKSVGRFTVVSKSWEKSIRSKNFITSFPFRSLTQPCRLLIALTNTDDETGLRSCCFFTSSSSWSSPSTSTSFLSRVTLTSPKNDDYYCTDHNKYYVNGLMSIGRIICNPTTGKSMTLPRLAKTGRKMLATRFFGYEPVNNEYKVLSMSRNRGQEHWSDFRVFTLGTKPKSWRPINGSVPHGTRSNGLCVDGFVYYIAYTGTGWMQLSLMRFDLKSEKIDVFARVSEDIRAFWRQGPLTLINYHGKVATAIQPFYSVPLIDLFVFEAGKQDFKEISFHNIPELYIRMIGIINHTGEIIFTPYCSREAKLFLYDLKGASYKNMKIEVDANHEYWYSYTNYFVGYVESLMPL